MPSQLDSPPLDGSPHGPAGECLQLRAGGVGLILDCTGSGLPRVLHWGFDVGPLSAAELDDLRVASEPPLVSGQPDVVVAVSLLPEQSAGWLGTPGVTGHRGGADFSTKFQVTGREHVVNPARGITHRVTVTAEDEAALLSLRLTVEMLDSGLVRLQAAVTNLGAVIFDLASLDVALPVPTEAVELLDLTGRHLRERAQQRSRFTLGTHLRESRRGRGHDASLIMAAGSAGFGWRYGELRAIHVAWSGNTRTFAERTNLGTSLLGGGELLLAGEVRLEQGQSYVGPWVFGSVGSGLDEMSARFHTFLRSRPEHPRSPRPVVLNVWEAVYFNHDLPTLREVAERAASVGVERYVLDDGWFSSRRDDTSGLGDWVVSPQVWPDGLAPIIDHVHGLGMDFGLWFEPEMVNPDSDLARAHPEWILSTGGRQPVLVRKQQALDLAHPGAYAHVRDQILAILRAYRIDFIKWDYNRDLIEAGHQPTGRAGVHEQTLAVYRLIDEIRAMHPGLEIESCAGGGGRADLGMLARADRIWGSDCIDPLERQHIEAGTSLLLPPELVGSHIASPVSHTTGRSHALDFRAGTALFSHLGIEWDLSTASREDLVRLGQWIAAYKRHRALLHSGTVVHSDQPDPALWVHGVVSADRREAIFAVVALSTSVVSPPGLVRLPGLEGGTRYRVEPLAPGNAIGGRTSHGGTSWWERGVELTGAVLGHVGLQAPVLNPEQLVLIHVVAA